MSTLIEGTDGLIQVGPTAALTTVGFITEFSVECSREITTRGPYIGNATLYKTRNAKTSSGTMSGDIPNDRDVGHTAILAAFEAGTDLRITLRGGDSDGGYTYTASNGILSGITIGGNAAEGYTFECSFEDGNGYTLAVSA